MVVYTSNKVNILIENILNTQIFAINIMLILNAEVSPGQLLFMVLLGYSFSKNENEIVYSCFGTLIHELYVLTAASCINANLV